MQCRQSSEKIRGVLNSLDHGHLRNDQMVEVPTGRKGQKKGIWVSKSGISTTTVRFWKLNLVLCVGYSISILLTDFSKIFLHITSREQNTGRINKLRILGPGQTLTLNMTGYY